MVGGGPFCIPEHVLATGKMASTGRPASLILALYQC